MRKIAFKSIISTAAVALNLGLAMNTAADQITDGAAVPTQTVVFTRAELATEEGLAAVERRIRRTARLVCGSNDHHVAGTLHAVARNEACYERAVEEAMAQLRTDLVASID